MDKTQKKGYEIDRDANDNLLVNVMSLNRCDSHYHQQVEMLYSHANNVTVICDQQKIILSKHDLIIFNTFCLHEYNDIKPTSALCLPLKYSRQFQSILPDNTSYTIIKKNPKSKNIVKAMAKFSKFNRVNSFIKDAIAYNLIGAIYDSEPELTPHRSGVASDISSKIITFINENYCSEINLDSLSNYCGYSRNYISKLFNGIFNCNFNEYLNIRRLQAFIEHQSTNDGASISLSAESVGFASTRTFYNAFKEHYKITPTEYLALKK